MVQCLHAGHRGLRKMQPLPWAMLLMVFIKKLVNIKKSDVTSKKLERLSIFLKNNNKPFDPQMSASPQWYFIATISAKRYNHVSLNFTDGKLVSIYTTVFETQ